MTNMTYALAFILLITIDISQQDDEYDSDDQADSFDSNVDLDAFPSLLDEEDYETELSVQDYMCPPAPKLPTNISSYCDRPACSHNTNCSNLADNNVTLICCYNGCLNTCMKPVDRPTVIDWVNDEPKSIKMLSVGEHVQLAHSSPQELTVMPGGCLLTPSQMTRLKEFEENKYVSHCFCDIGSVLCKLTDR